MSTQKASKHVAPTTPGWELLVNAAGAVTSDEATRDEALTLMTHLVARKDEHIPEDHVMRVIAAVAAAASKVSDQGWPDVFVEFVESQIGHTGLEQLLEGSKFEVILCEKHGVHVYCKERTHRVISIVVMDIEDLGEILRKLYQEF